MKRFIEGENRFQSTLFPESLEDYIADDNPVRVIDAFVEGLNLKQLGFDRAEPSETGRPGYEPTVMLKIYVYGYLNRLTTTRVLEQETHRNVDLIWLTGRLMPDHKTIGEFRRNNRKAIRRVCAEFVGICRELKLFEQVIVAIDGSKFKAVNSRDKNFTRKSIKRRMKRLQEHINRYLTILDEADKRAPEEHKYTAEELAEKIASMKEQMGRLQVIEEQVQAHPDKQVSLTDPDARSMAKAGGGSQVGYNVQTAVESDNHLIVAHEVTNATTDRSQLASMATKAKAALGEQAAEAATEEGEDQEALTVVADAGYYKGEEIVECYAAGIKALVPKVDTSGRKNTGRYSKADFRYDAERNEYVCPAGQRLMYRFDSIEHGKTLWVYMKYGCSSCPLRAKCTTSNAKRIKRWEKEHILEAAEAELKKQPNAMRQRKKLVEHPYGTIKHCMGATHFVMKRLPNVRAEMSLHVLAYNLRRVINILGVPKLIAELQAV
ncbi:MAG: IS1182 family transposase [Woeseiaceae bacterium]